ncbi:MAG: phosphatase PAP2 family protein [Prevotellaceae bacterium]|nr:phosphatase PAP2 family protein [Prevotellaceae bacterium]
MDKLIALDQQLLLLLNGRGPVWLDNLMWHFSSTWTWAPLILLLLFVTLRSYTPRQFIVFLAALALAILLADQLSAAILKPLFHRLRPTREPGLMEMVRTVRGYRGGQYSFVSSHACNWLAVTTYLTLALRGRLLALSLALVAALVCYSRIYLGVHYPGDILCGAVLGFVVGLLTYQVFAICFRWKEERPRLAGFRPTKGTQVRGRTLLVLAVCLTLICVCALSFFC